jgi:hypothetical protein
VVNEAFKVRIFNDVFEEASDFVVVREDEEGPAVLIDFYCFLLLFL